MRGKLYCIHYIMRQETPLGDCILYALSGSFADKAAGLRRLSPFLTQRIRIDKRMKILTHKQYSVNYIETLMDTVKSSIDFYEGSKSFDELCYAEIEGNRNYNTQNPCLPAGRQITNKLKGKRKKVKIHLL